MTERDNAQRDRKTDGLGQQVLVALGRVMYALLGAGIAAYAGLQVMIYKVDTLQAHAEEDKAGFKELYRDIATLKEWVRTHERTCK